MSADVNVRRIVGTRYFVEDRLGFGLIFKFVGKFEISSLLASRLAIFQEHILLLQVSELFPRVILEKMTFRMRAILTREYHTG